MIFKQNCKIRSIEYIHKVISTTTLNNNLEKLNHKLRIPSKFNCKMHIFRSFFELIEKLIEVKHPYNL